MNMTPEEICRSYREAKKKMEQIKILSELNATTEEEIKKILKENGYLKTGPKTAIMQTALKQPKLETPETNIQPKQEVVMPTEETVETIVAQVAHAKSPSSQRPTNLTADSTSTAEDLADCIARLESEMEKLDDSVSSAQVERLIAADARLQQMVYRIVGKQAEQAMNKMQSDSTANYVIF
jgi:hypothetical protein